MPLLPASEDIENLVLELESKTEINKNTKKILELLEDKKESKSSKIQKPEKPTKPQEPGKVDTTNKTGKTELPKTGETSNILISIFGFTLLLVGISLYIYKMRKSSLVEK